MKFGCHVSIRDGYLGAAKRALSYNARCYQYFPKNPRSLSVKEFERADAEECKNFCLEHNLESVAHTPYPTSITPTEEKRELTVQSVLNDLEIANECGSIGVVVHFGKQISTADPLKSYHLMIEMLNEILSQWEGDALLLLENNAGPPGSIGTTLQELTHVRNLCEFPEKIGFCLDTCHAFASGLWTGGNTDELFEMADYFEQLKAVHLNNSKYPLGSGKDRHANIFNTGHIREEQFDQLLTASLLKDVPFILETPSDEGVTHKEEIRLLNEKWPD